LAIAMRTQAAASNLRASLPALTATGTRRFLVAGSNTTQFVGASGRDRQFPTVTGIDLRRRLSRQW